MGVVAALTRNTGVLIGVAVLLLYLYGPRADRPPDGAGARFAPRYRLRADALWMLLIPAGLAAFAIYTWIVYDTPFASYDAQAIFHREFLGPFSALWYGGRDVATGGATAAR